jgi:hypothetical protein
MKNTKYSQNRNEILFFLSMESKYNKQVIIKKLTLLNNNYFNYYNVIKAS